MNLERDERQHAADDDALHDVRDDVPPPQEGGPSGSATAILRATGLICICHYINFDDLSRDPGARCLASKKWAFAGTNIN